MEIMIEDLMEQLVQAVGVICTSPPVNRPMAASAVNCVR